VSDDSKKFKEVRFNLPRRLFDFLNKVKALAGQRNAATRRGARGCGASEYPNRPVDALAIDRRLLEDEDRLALQKARAADGICTHWIRDCAHEGEATIAHVDRDVFQVEVRAVGQVDQHHTAGP